MIPIYGFLEKDTIGLLILAYPNDTAEDLITKLQLSAAIRVKPKDTMALLYNKQIINPKTTVADIGFQALDHFFVVTAEHV